MRVWRIASAAWAAFDGEGARLHGGRWTPTGLAVTYTSATLSLAALERFVNLDPDLEPADLVFVHADLSSGISMQVVEIANLPANWREYPAPESLHAIGQQWLKSAKDAVLSVPSAVIPHERNYVLNPTHPDLARLTLSKPAPFSFDPRMWRPRKGGTARSKRLN